MLQIRASSVCVHIRRLFCICWDAAYSRATPPALCQVQVALGSYNTKLPLVPHPLSPCHRSSCALYSSPCHPHLCPPPRGTASQEGHQWSYASRLLRAMHTIQLHKYLLLMVMCVPVFILLMSTDWKHPGSHENGCA